MHQPGNNSDESEDYQEILLDITVPMPENVTLSAAERKVVELFTRTCAGAVVAWFSLRQLLQEVNTYRAFRRESR